MVSAPLPHCLSSSSKRRPWMNFWVSQQTWGAQKLNTPRVFCHHQPIAFAWRRIKKSPGFGGGSGPRTRSVESLEVNKPSECCVFVRPKELLQSFVDDELSETRGWQWFVQLSHRQILSETRLSSGGRNNLLEYKICGHKSSPMPM